MGPYILHMPYRNFICWKQVKFFILSGTLLLRETPFHMVNCLKPFDFKLFCVCTLKWGAAFGTLAHNFCFVLTNIWLASELIKCSSRVIDELFSKTMQKLSAKLLKEALTASLKEGGPRPSPRSPPLIWNLFTGRWVVYLESSCANVGKDLHLYLTHVVNNCIGEWSFSRLNTVCIINKFSMTKSTKCNL